MILPKPEDALHKAVMVRLLIHILDEPSLSQNLFFKGGTCALMLGFLDRFSLDLDFDLKKESGKEMARKNLKDIFKRAGFTIKEEAKDSLFFVLKYLSPKGKRNTLKISIVDNPAKQNTYGVFLLPEIDRFANCQTKETMFSHKLVALVDRFEKYKTIAGRDIYDIHHFFSQGFSYNKKVIEERRGIKTKTYFRQLIKFIEKRVTQKVLSEDLNYLLPSLKFSQIRKTLKAEVLMFLKDELKNLE